MHINYVIHLLALRLWIPHNYDLERCGDCVSETCLLRQSNAKSIFQMDALLPDFDMLLFNCCREGEALCHAADLKKKKKKCVENQKLANRHSSFAARQTKENKMLKSMMVYKNLQRQ